MKKGSGTKGKSSPLVDTRVIYCGDNLEQLEKFPDECVDLIYIDPPFNSNRNYEVFWGEAKEKRAFEDRHASTQAYLDFMRPRCKELHRVLKKTGSFYYHCDWHASHYVKMMLDQIFSENNFINEVIWKRTSAHSDAKQGSKHLGRVHDSIFLYSKSDDCYFNHLYRPYSKDYTDAFYKYVEPETGRRYRLDNLTAPGGGAKGKGNPHYEFLGVTRYWRYSKENMQRLYEEGRIVQTKPGRVPAYKRYLDEGKGVPLGTVWDDIGPVQGQGGEGLGYPTQKPLKLLERIIEISSKANDVVLDAFCGCGTALVAAENLGRQWIGIDISPTSCYVMAKRLKNVCHLPQSAAQQLVGKGFIVQNLPQSEDRLRKMPPFEFQNWAVNELNGVTNQRKTGDMGIDGWIFLPASEATKKRGKATGELPFTDNCIPVQVKQKDKVGRPDIDSLEAALMRQDMPKGVMVGFGFSSDALTEIEAFYHRGKRLIKAFTVKDILDGDIARKLA